MLQWPHSVTLELLTNWSIRHVVTVVGMREQNKIGYRAMTAFQKQLTNCNGMDTATLVTRST